MKLSQWAKEQGLAYKGARRMRKAGQLPVLAETATDRHDPRQASGNAFPWRGTVCPSFFFGSEKGCGRLDFEKKKAALENEGRKRARMLTGFAYKQMIRHLGAAAFRAGVEVFQVNPAYTSTIGAVNYAYRYGISIHQGAAIAIARRSMDLSERPASGVAHIPTPGGDHLTFPVPERKRGKHVWSLWSKVARQIRAALTAHLLLLRKNPRSTPAVLSFRPQRAT